MFFAIVTLCLPAFAAKTVLTTVVPERMVNLTVKIEGEGCVYAEDKRIEKSGSIALYGKKQTEFKFAAYKGSELKSVIYNGKEVTPLLEGDKGVFEVKDGDILTAVFCKINTTPKTGDKSPAAIYVFLLTAALGCFAAAAKNMRKNKKAP